MAQRFAVIEAPSGWQLWRVCLEDVGPGCRRAMDCQCRRTEQGPLRTLLGSYRSERMALDALGPLLEAWGEALGDPRRATRSGAPGDGFQLGLFDGGTLDESDVPF